LGIGGWIGVGKSTICSFFKEELCADVLSLDSISHELYEVPEVSSALRKVKCYILHYSVISFIDINLYK